METVVHIDRVEITVSAPEKPFFLTVERAANVAAFARMPAAQDPGIQHPEYHAVTLSQVCDRLEISERWIRELVKRHGMPVRTVPWPGGYRFVFSDADVQRLSRIHAANQERLKLLHPELYKATQKNRRSPRTRTRSPWM
jgi:hypothetical protein